MSAQALYLFDDRGNPTWDSYSVTGGVIADVRAFAAADAAVLTYPAFPWRSVEIFSLFSNIAAGSLGVTTDMDLGYPRVTVTAASVPRRFLVLVT